MKKLFILLCFLISSKALAALTDSDIQGQWQYCSFNPANDPSSVISISLRAHFLQGQFTWHVQIFNSVDCSGQVLSAETTEGTYVLQGANTINPNLTNIDLSAALDGQTFNNYMTTSITPNGYLCLSSGSIDSASRKLDCSMRLNR